MIEIVIGIFTVLIVFAVLILSVGIAAELYGIVRTCLILLILSITFIMFFTHLKTQMASNECEKCNISKQHKQLN